MIDIDDVVSQTFLRQGHWYQELDSTNNRALEIAADCEIETPVLLGATHQTAGRGRGSNRWWSSNGTLKFSVLLDMKDLGIAQSDWPRFSLGTALSVAETLESYVPARRVGVKWPNDVWIGQRKVCGILIEQSDRVSDRLIVGIGLNINTDFAEAPEEIRSVATSLFAESGQQFDQQAVLIQFLRRWEQTMMAQRSGNWSLPALWSRLCVLIGRQVIVSSTAEQLFGQCLGIANDGALLVDTGAIRRCYAGTVRLVATSDSA